MTTNTWNAEEVFEIALQIERNGHKFYSLAAEKAEDEKPRKLFSDLAYWETEHEKKFASLQAEVAKDPQQALKLDPNQEEVKYLQAFAQGKIFDLKRGPEELLEACEYKFDMILRAAIATEKESVVFYMAMQGMCKSEEHKEMIGKIIEEEMSHVRFLSDLLDAVK